MMKIYRTFSLQGLQLLFKDKDGKRIEVKFRGGVEIDSTARFPTSDPALQELMEKSSGFGRDYYIESEVSTSANEAPAEPAPVEKAPETKTEIPSEIKGSERFLNLVEMKNRMAELGIEFPDDANYPAAKAAAQKAGYDFQVNKK